MKHLIAKVVLIKFIINVIMKKLNKGKIIKYLIKYEKLVNSDPSKIIIQSLLYNINEGFFDD